MLAGVLLHGFISWLNFLTPFLIFAMLYITFSQLDVHKLRIKWFHIVLLLFQLGAALVTYYALRSQGEVVAQGAMMCVFAPAAMASVVIGTMLGANANTMTTFILLSNATVAVVAPLWFTYIAPSAQFSFLECSWLIFKRTAPTILLPFFAAWATQVYAKRVHAYLLDHQIWSFYLWAVSLTILMGSITEYVVSQPESNYRTMGILFGISFAVCIAQFAIGRLTGWLFGDSVAGGQSLGQKNTLLAIWLTQSYLNPLASLAPAGYVVWQNLVNSLQLWHKNRS